MSAARRSSLAAALTLAVVHANEANAEEPFPIISLRDATVGVGSTGAPAGWIALPTLALSPSGGSSLRPVLEIDAIDVQRGAVVPILRLELKLPVADFVLDWSPDPALGTHARLRVSLN
ncbi:MAG: hypothetical protein U0414_27305 [Polyangiaceae bacterium]